MCRWLAYIGSPLFIDTLVVKPRHSLLAQSLDTKMNFRADGSPWATNGDGFGVGWYGSRETPGLYRDTHPAWNDVNLHELTGQIRAHTFFAHIRATTTGQVQRANCHPFKHGRWLFQHNGHVDGFERIRRDLQLDIAPELYPHLQGTTDSETLFLLALTYGLTEDPAAAFARMVGRVERAYLEHEMEEELQISCAATDGDAVYTLRYCNSDDAAKSQFFARGAAAIDDIKDGSHLMPTDAVVIVSEPLDELSDVWVEVPESSMLVVRRGEVTQHEFAPAA